MKFKVLLASAICAITISLPSHAAQGDYNFRFSPLGLLLGMVDVHFDFKMNDKWTLGPRFSYWNLNVASTDPAFSDFSVKFLGLGARANWFKNGTYTDGLYVGPSLAYQSVAAASGSSSASVGLVVLSTVVGYGWFWDSFNMQLGGGLSLPMGTTKVTVDDGAGNREEVNASGAGGNLALEWTIGWTF